MAGSTQQEQNMREEHSLAAAETTMTVATSIAIDGANYTREWRSWGMARARATHEYNQRANMKKWRDMRRANLTFYLIYYGKKWHSRAYPMEWNCALYIVIGFPFFSLLWLPNKFLGFEEKESISLSGYQTSPNWLFVFVWLVVFLFHYYFPSILRCISAYFW